MPAPIPFDTMTALVVDDEKFSLSIVTRLTRSIGFSRVLNATNGIAALSVLRDRSLPRIDIIVADFNMPRMNGLEMLHYIRSGEESIRRDLPLIMLTGNTDKDLVGTAIALDVDAFLAKPVSLTTLENRITRVLENPVHPKEPEHYKKIHVPTEPVSNAPQQIEEPEEPKLIQEDAGSKIALSDLKAGHILAEDMVAGGTLLLPKDTKITGSLVSRIHDLEHLKTLIDDVWVYNP
jgi:two-component system chemotaxis response regulator CheY